MENTHEFSLKVIARFQNQASASMAEGILLESGIPCMLQDELMAQIYVPAMMGGIRLSVPNEHAITAREILSAQVLTGMQIVPPDRA